MKCFYLHESTLFSVIGNKTDRDDREIPIAVGEDFAKQQGMYFLETSAKEADNVERLFYEIAAELIEQARSKEVPRSETAGTGGISNLGQKTNLLGQSNCCNSLSSSASFGNGFTSSNSRQSTNNNYTSHDSSFKDTQN